MRNFYRLCTGLNMGQVMHSLSRQPNLWNEYTFRTTFPNTPFGDNDDIILRFAPPETCAKGIYDVINSNNSVWYPAIHKLPEVKDVVLDVMRYSRAYALDRLLITRLKPGGKILEHTDDEGSYSNTGDVERLHVVLQGLPGSNFICGDETVNMQTGEVWWFNPHKPHAAVNNSSMERIHLLVDLRYMP